MPVCFLGFIKGDTAGTKSAIDRVWDEVISPLTKSCLMLDRTVNEERDNLAKFGQRRLEIKYLAGKPERFVCSPAYSHRSLIEAVFPKPLLLSARLVNRSSGLWRVCIMLSSGVYLITRENVSADLEAYEGERRAPRHAGGANLSVTEARSSVRAATS